jgi:hypothetical protein
MTCEAFKGEFMVPVSACAEFTVELRVPVSDGLEYLRSIFMVHMNDNMSMYSGVSFYSASPTYLAVSKISPSVLLPQDSLWSEFFVSVYQQDSSYHAICMLCSISTDIIFQRCTVYSLGLLCNSRGHMA